MEPAPPILADLLARAVRGDFGERQGVYLVPMPGDAFMRLSTRAADALRLHAEGMSLEQAATATANGASSWTGAHLAQIRDRLVARAYSHESTKDSFGFYGRRQLLAASTVERIARRLTILYAPIVAILAIITMCVALATTVDLAHSPDASDVVFGYVWMVASLVAHELGHATAVTTFGGRPGPIGFTFYIIYPALYSDVTEAWRLRRRQRVVVDVGGVYFQLGFIAVVAVLSRFVALPGVQLGIVLVALTVAMTMHPFLKFDGYWMLSDALGVANLGKWRGVALRNAWRRLRRRERETLPWRPITTAVVIIYAVASSVFATAFTIYLLPRMWRALMSYPAYVRAVIAEVEQRGALHSSAPWLALAGSTVVLLFGLRVLYVTLARCRSFVQRARRG